MTDYEEGVAAYRALLTSPHLAWVDRNIPAITAMKLFKPPAVEHDMQMSRPYDKDRSEWMRGFNAEREQQL